MISAFLSTSLLLAAPIGVFDFDVVEFNRKSEQIPGKPELTLLHEGWEYRFANAANLASFRASRARFEVQMGGACARMGELSGLGNPKFPVISKGKLYIFASESCRNTFIENPESFILPSPARPSWSPEARLRGGAIADRLIHWAGTREMIMPLAVRKSWSEKVVSGGREYTHTVVRSSRPGGWFTFSDRWNESSWTYATDGSKAWCLASGEAERPLAKQQMDALNRLSAWSIPVLYRGIASGAAEVAEAGSSDRLNVFLNGQQLTLSIDPVTDRLLSVSGITRGPDGRVGRQTIDYSAWIQVGGVRLPLAWSGRFNGTAEPALSRVGVEYKSLSRQDQA